MKRSSILMILIILIISACERSTINDDKVFTGVAALRHNSYVTTASGNRTEGTSGLLVTKNGIVQTETMGRLLCNESLFELIAGQSIQSGNVIVSNDLENLYVTYQAANGWKIKEIHLFVGEFEEIPVNNHNVPVPGQFPIKESFDPEVEMVTYEISLSGHELPWCPYVLAHAVVVKEGQEETAWGKGERSFEDAFDIARWGWIIRYCTEECKEKELVIASKSYVVDSRTYSAENKNPLWWVVTKGEGSISNCLGIGYNIYKPVANETGEYDLIKWGRTDDVQGKMTAFYSVEGQVKYLNVILELSDENMWLSKTYLYVGTLAGLGKYGYTYNDKPCYEFYNWFFTKEETSNTHTFKIAVSDIKEK